MLSGCGSHTEQSPPQPMSIECANESMKAMRGVFVCVLASIT